MRTFVFLAAVLFVNLPVVAQAPAWGGLWRLDIARSEFVPAPAPYVRGTRRIETSGAGVRIIEEFVRPRGGLVHLEWTGQLDGHDYRVHGVDLFVTYAYRQTDARTLEGTVKVDGVVTSTSRETISPDGGTFTVVTVGQNTQAGMKTTMRFTRVRP